MDRESLYVLLFGRAMLWADPGAAEGAGRREHCEVTNVDCDGSVK